MTPDVIRNATHTAATAAGSFWRGALLHVRQGYCGDPKKPKEQKATITVAWRPSPAEIDAIVRGASVQVTLVTVFLPEMAVEVDEPGARRNVQ